METGHWLVLGNLLGTLAMSGVIWMVQLVHYPLFAGVGSDGFVAYEAAHQTRITWIVFPAMVLELGTAAALVWLRPDAVPPWMVWVGLGLVGVVWLSTAFVQVPLHTALSAGFDGDAHARLVTTNWIRTAAWTLRAGLVLWMTALLMR
ncbi:MAG: hypothetical protein ABJF88_03625 [Rhodothermales bacterium]